MSLESLRHEIDAIDAKLVVLLAQRARLAKEAVKYKSTAAQVEAKGRQEQVVANVRRMAEQHGLPPQMAETIYRTIMAEFIAMERRDAGM